MPPSPLVSASPGAVLPMTPLQGTAVQWGESERKMNPFGTASAASGTRWGALPVQLPQPHACHPPPL